MWVCLWIYSILEIFKMAKSGLSRGQIKKLKKTDTPKSGHSLPATEPVFHFKHYLVWFGNHPKKFHHNHLTSNHVSPVRSFKNKRILNRIDNTWKNQLKHLGMLDVQLTPPFVEVWAPCCVWSPDTRASMRGSFRSVSSGTVVLTLFATELSCAGRR